MSTFAIRRRDGADHGAPLLRTLRGKLAGIAGLAAVALTLGVAAPARADTTLLNVSYDVARELFKDINPALHRRLEEADRRDPGHQAVARRLQQAGARRGRRPGSVGRDDEPGQ